MFKPLFNSEYWNQLSSICINFLSSTILYWYANSYIITCFRHDSTHTHYNLLYCNHSTYFQTVLLYNNEMEHISRILYTSNEVHIPYTLSYQLLLPCVSFSITLSWLLYFNVLKCRFNFRRKHICEIFGHLLLKNFIVFEDSIIILFTVFRKEDMIFYA